MTPLQEIILTASLTLIGGMILFVLSQIFIESVIKPFIGYKSLVGKICQSLVFNAAFIVSSSAKVNLDRHLSISKEIRMLSGEMRGFYSSLPFPFLLHRLSLIPPDKDFYEAARILIGISNRMLDLDPQHMELQSDLKKIEKLLRIKMDIG